MTNVNSQLASARSIDELVAQFDELGRRVRVLEGRAGIAAPSDQARLVALEAVVAPPAPAPVAQTIVLLDLSIGDGYYGSTADIMAGTYTPPRAGGTYVLEGQLDCRAEAWDNFVGAPRRGVGTVSAGGSSANTELAQPSSGWGAGPRSTITKRDSFATGAGTFAANWHLIVTGANQIHVYSGWLRVTWSG